MGCRVFILFAADGCRAKVTDTPEAPVPGAPAPTTSAPSVPILMTPVATTTARDVDAPAGARSSARLRALHQTDAEKAPPISGGVYHIIGWDQSRRS
jgi:hypothetical protein